MDTANAKTGPAHEPTLKEGGTGRSPVRSEGQFGRLGFWILAVVGLAFVLTVFNALPGHTPTPQYLTGDATFADCYRQARERGVDACLNFGFPKGAPKTFGIPVSVAGSYLVKDGFVSLSSIKLLYTGLVFIAYLGAVALFRRITGNAVLALAGAVLFLGSTTVYKFADYGSLGLGIALIPFYLLVDLRLLDAVSLGQRASRVAPWLAVVIVTRCFALFLDGYSFLFSCALSMSCMLLVPLLARKFRTALLTPALYTLACAIAAFSYRLYFPSDALGTTPLDGFRAQGVDTFALLSPQTDSVYHRWIGIGGKIDPLVTYSDGASSNGIFLGYAWILAAAVLLVWFAKKRTIPHATYLAPIILTGLAALLLALGPSLKFQSFRETPVESITASHYSMPEEAAVATLPTGWIYQKVPGIKTARALVRWLTLTRLAIALVVIVAVVTLLQHKRPVFAYSLLALALLELLPNFDAHLGRGKVAYAHAYALYYDYPRSLQMHVKAGERALFVELHDRPGGNQYTVNTLCTRASIYCYNTGGDKASVVVQRHWPVDVLDATRRRRLTSSVERIFQSHLADVVVIPLFDLRGSAYSERSGAVDIESVLASAQKLAEALDMPLTLGDRFAYIRPRMTASTEDSSEACGLSCWRAWPDLDIGVPAWGPKHGYPGRGINRQPDGQSVLWVLITDAERTSALALGDTLLPTRSSRTTLTGAIPQNLLDTFVPGARYPLYLINTNREEKLFLGYLNISDVGT